MNQQQLSEDAKQTERGTRSSTGACEGAAVLSCLFIWRTDMCILWKRESDSGGGSSSDQSDGSVVRLTLRPLPRCGGGVTRVTNTLRESN